MGFRASNAKPVADQNLVDAANESLEEIRVDDPTVTDDHDEGCPDKSTDLY